MSDEGTNHPQDRPPQEWSSRPTPEPPPGPHELAPDELGPQEFVEVPTGIAVFANNFVDEGTPPREWAERLYNVSRWTPMARGGHFAPVEEPELLARDIVGFFAGL